MVSIYMDSDLVAGLELVRTRDGVPIAESARRAIRQWLNERKALSTVKRRHKSR
jgi:Ribbon-helix-helix protein, copG family